MRRTFSTLLARSGALVLGVAALTGCIKMDMDMKLTSDDKVSGSVIVGFSDQAITAMGQKPADFAKEMVKESATQTNDPKNKLPAGSKLSVKAYSKGGFSGVESVFSNMPITELSRATGAASDAAASAGASGGSSSKDDFKIVRKGNTFVFTGAIDMATGDTGSTGGMDLSSFGKPEMRIAITFPGSVTKHNGKLSGKTVTWVPVLGKKTTMSATANAR
jgi:hypothetical protein